MYRTQRSIRFGLKTRIEKVGRNIVYYCQYTLKTLKPVFRKKEKRGVEVEILYSTERKLERIQGMPHAGKIRDIKTPLVSPADMVFDLG